jgi:hypothetical protein
MGQEILLFGTAGLAVFLPRLRCAYYGQALAIDFLVCGQAKHGRTVPALLRRELLQFPILAAPVGLARRP